MVTTVLLLSLAAVVYYLYSLVASLRRNIARAKGSGLPYYVSRECRRPSAAPFRAQQ